MRQNKPLRRSRNFYENAAASPTKMLMNARYQKKTIASAGPSFALLTQVKPMAVSTSVQIAKMSINDPAVYKTGFSVALNSAPRFVATGLLMLKLSGLMP